MKGEYDVWISCVLVLIILWIMYDFHFFILLQYIPYVIYTLFDTLVKKGAMMIKYGGYKSTIK